jgi:hypothetical protein
VRNGHRQDGDQHQQRADQGVDDELDGGVDAPRAAPDADHQVHRDEAELPEDVEQEQVQADEDAQHAHHQQQHGGVVLLDPRLDGVPGVEDRDHAEDGGQDHQHHRQAVDAQPVAHPEGRNPIGLLAELELWSGRVVSEQQEAEGAAGERRQQRDPSDGPMSVARHQQQHEHADHRREDHQAEDRQGLRQVNHCRITR